MNGEHVLSQISGDNNVMIVNSSVTVNNYVCANPKHVTPTSDDEEEKRQDVKPGGNSNDETHMVINPSGNSSGQSHTRLSFTPLSGSNKSRWSGKIDSLKTSDTTVRCDQELYYTKDSEIAAGSDGTHVFAGIFGKKPVAIKRCVLLSVKEKAKTVARCLLEKPLVHVLIPDRIVENDNFIYYVSKLCEWNLREVIEEPTNPFRSNLNHIRRKVICVEFLKGLKELHDCHILHRDLKPSNVLIDDGGRVLVADFGVSRLLTDKTSTVTEGVGSMCWMAKEVLKASGTDVRYEFSADIQVAGYLLYYILTDGHIPHEATFLYKRDMPAVIGKIRNDEYSLEHLKDRLSKGLVERMINPISGLRPNISECLSDFQSEALPPSDDSSTPENAKTQGPESGSSPRKLRGATPPSSGNRSIPENAVAQGEVYY